ncbi:DNA helicase PIF1, ATP-dependent [Tanacetum coccineum]
MIEAKRMSFNRKQQKELRSETYSKLAKLAEDPESGVQLCGKNMVLSSSFTGSPRYMMQNYLDAMTICKSYGYSDLFITFTCNPNWPEISCFVAEQNLKSEDRPYVITRVFKMKLDSLMKDLKDRHIFGHVKGDGNTITKSETDLHNGYVVPYNPGLLRRYQSHINVEWCNQIGSIKYLFKYINKGPDRVTAAVDGEEVDEIKDFYDCRYLSACEAAWRIYGFDIHYRTPPVERLPFHLQDEQSVIFDATESIDYTLEKSSVNETKFVQWMELNKTNTLASTLLYAEIPKYFVWNTHKRIWDERQRGFSLGRIHHVPPSWGELFYLRILLNKVKGPKEWKELKTFDKVVYPTYRDACYARGLLQDDKEYIDGLMEASEWGMGDYLRSFFVMLLMTDSMSRPEYVWEKTWHKMAEDVENVERIKQNNPDLKLSDIEKKNICLTYIEHMLLCNNKTLKNILNMPYPNAEYTMEGYNRLIYDETSYKKDELKNQHETMYGSLTSEQKGIYSTVMDAVANNTGGMFFVYGYGGTGKTFLYKTMSAALRSQGEIVLNVASSGIAALLLEGGRTAHSRFAIPINILEDSMCHIPADSHLADLIRKAKLIIWDEAPMIQSYCYEAFDRTLRDICRSDPSEPSNRVFGGKVVLFGGDFRQILPVIPNASRNDVNLKKKIQEFADWILNIGNRNNDSKNVGESTVEFPDEMIIPESDDYVGSIIAETYPKLLQNLWNPTFFQERAILAPTHEMVDIINERMMALIPGEETIYESSDSVSLVDDDTNFDDSIYTTDFLNGIKMSGLPKHAIKLKIGTPVMLMRNIDQKAGLCNGTRLQVLRMGINVIEGKIISGGSVGKICAIPRMPRANTITGGVVFTKAGILTWAVVRGTIKSQKQTRIEGSVLRQRR